jgi:Fic family protein
MKPYIPDVLPLENLDYKRLFAVAGAANSELARYDGLLQGITNPEVMLSPLTNEEAVLSSKIEGTQATVDEVLEQEAGLIKEGRKGEDIREIVNYRTALMTSYEYLKDYPITISFVKQLHKILLDSTRGQDKTPGEIRKDQNWIGTHGCTIEQATFVPPNPLQLQDHLEAWQNYIVSNDIDILLQAAVIHAQFELLHPFKDGNGRLGRIMIPLFLYQKKVLSQPMFYLSSYLEANREEYYYRLQNISLEKDWNGWIEFFLKAITIQSKSNSQKVKNIMGLYEEMKQNIHDITHSQYTIHILDAMFYRPIFESTYMVKHAKIPKTSVKSLIPKLKKSGVLTEIRPASGNSPSILAFGKLLNITEGKNVF